MTMPSERTRAVIYALRFLQSLLDPKQTPKVPLAVRRQASRVLRHFPRNYDMRMVGRLPDQNIFGELEDEEFEA